MTTHTSKVDLQKLFSHAWEDFKKEWKVLVGMFLIIFVVGNLPNWLGSNNVGIAMISSLLSIAFFVVSIWLNYNNTKTYLRVVRNQKIQLNDLFEWGQGDYIKRVLFFFLTSLLFGVAVFVGLIFLILPGIYLAIKWIFAPYLVLDKQMKIGDAFTTSWNMTRGQEWKILILGLVWIVAGIAGIITLGVGFIVIVPLMQLVTMRLYTQLNHGDAHTTHKEHTLEASH